MAGKLIYLMPVSLDGYIEGKDGRFDWAEPDEQVHRFINDLIRPVGTYLYGRRMYDTMVYWEGAEIPAETPAYIRDFAEIWKAADKIVYSKALDKVSSQQTRIERAFDADAVRQMKARETRALAVAGPNLAAQAFEAGLVDECQLLISPCVLGGGKRVLPDDVELKLELLDERRFDNGTVYLHYRCLSSEIEVVRK